MERPCGSQADLLAKNRGELKLVRESPLDRNIGNENRKEHQNALSHFYPALLKAGCGACSKLVAKSTGCVLRPQPTSLARMVKGDQVT
jgi:hypothetical protein